MTNVGLWDRWYSFFGPDDPPQPYGASETYALGAEWLQDCSMVEDWGCGKGWLRTLIPGDRYRGIDGSSSPFADEVVDLAHYKSSVPGVFMRHVLEHDFRWPKILSNALSSATERMALVLFTPLGAETRNLEWDEEPHVPNLSFALSDLERIFSNYSVTWTQETIQSSSTKYKEETIFRLSSQ